MTQAVAGLLTSVIIDSRDLTGYSAYELLRAAANGYIGIDQRLIHALLDRPDQTLAGIVRFAGENTEDRISLDGDLVSIFHYLKAPAGLPFLVELARRDPLDIADDLVEAFVAIGTPALDPLLELYAELDPGSASEVAFLLAGMGVKDPRILELLLQRLDIDWSDALFHLEVYGDPGAIPVLESRLAFTESDEVQLDLRDTIRELQQPKPQTVVSEFNIWDLYPPDDEPAFELMPEGEVLEFLDAPDEFLRASAACSFFGQEFSVAVRAKLLETARQDPSPMVRATCWRNFFDLVEEEPELRRTLLDRLSNPATDALERTGLAIALAQHSDQPLVRAAILTAVEDPSMRARGLEAVWRSFDDSFRQLPAKYIDDPDIEVRRNAIWGIGYLRITSDAGLLRKFFEIESLRPDALHNYAIAAPGVTNRKKVFELYEKIAELAQGFADGEEEIVKAGLDVRLMNAGLPPIFDAGDSEPEPEGPATAVKIGRNDPCPCGSGKKYKKCCGQ